MHRPTRQTALHLLLLVSIGNPPYQDTTPTKKEIEATVTYGVRAFLHGHLPQR